MCGAGTERGRMVSIKDHPFYERLRQLSPKEVAAWILGDVPVEDADTSQRKAAFRSIAKHITTGRAERTKFGFNSDTNGEIARAMEWAYKAGQRSTKRK